MKKQQHNRETSIINIENTLDSVQGVIYDQTKEYIDLNQISGDACRIY